MARKDWNPLNSARYILMNVLKEANIRGQSEINGTLSK